MKRLICLVLLGVYAAGAVAQEQPLLKILSETGREQSDLPVYALHEAPREAEAALSAGFSGTWLRVYRLMQEYRRVEEGIPVEPAWILLSSRQGGFARRGFVLSGQEKSESDYVDVFHGWRLSGTYGAMDQIVPHELAHALRRQLAGELEGGRTNQIHALSVRTDRVVAFNEGFAEHLQAMALEHSPDVPAMDSMAQDTERIELAYRHLEDYGRELSAAFAPASPMRLGFVAWFSNDEDVLRYDAVKENRYARAPQVPDPLIDKHPYRAYLYESVVPASEDDPLKSPGRMASSEGVIAAFFYRWANDVALMARPGPAFMYDSVPLDTEANDALVHGYVKMLVAMHRTRPQTIYDFINGYVEVFPADAQDVRRIAVEVFNDDMAHAPVELWLTNRDMTTGTTLFDQYRGMPRVHTFDLNAASLADLTALPGVGRTLAERVIGALPVSSVNRLAEVEGMTEEILADLHGRMDDMEVLEAELEAETELNLSVRSILMPGILRAVMVLIVSGVLGGWLYTRIRVKTGLKPLRWYRVVLNATVVALVGCLSGWLVGWFGLAAVLAVWLLFGVPSSTYLWYRKRRMPALRMALAWAVAAVPAAILTGIWG